MQFQAQDRRLDPQYASLMRKIKFLVPEKGVVKKRKFKPLKYEFEHEKSLWWKIEGLQVDFPENFKIAVWAWNYLYEGIHEGMYK